MAEMSAPSRSAHQLLFSPQEVSPRHPPKISHAPFKDQPCTRQRSAKDLRTIFNTYWRAFHSVTLSLPEFSPQFSVTVVANFLSESSVPQWPLPCANWLRISKCGTQTSSINTMCKPVRNANFRAPPRPSESEALELEPSNLYSNKLSRDNNIH